MPQRSQTGRRIRMLRMDRGVSQQDLARDAGISAPYLNLIEHDRRRIGGAVLQSLAAALGVDPDHLSTVPDAGVLAGITTAVDAGTEPHDLFAERFPGWAKVVTKQARRIELLEAQVESISNRMAHDPVLAGALHQVLSTATSIQSTATILVEGAGDADWEKRFHDNIYGDSLRLSEVSQSLVAYLEQQSAAPDKTPQEEVTSYLDARGHHISELEVGQSVDLDGLSPAAQVVLAPWLRRYAQDALILPLDRFSKVAANAAYDPGVIAQGFGVPFAMVLRRLAALPVGADHPSIGLVICDGAGVVRYLKAGSDVGLAFQGDACPIWPLYQCLTQPGRPVTDVVEIAGEMSQRLTTYAVCEYSGVVLPNQPPQIEATMVMIADAPKVAHRVVGPGCLQCAADNCPARREPARRITS